jgi:hypothetical protein
LAEPKLITDKLAQAKCNDLLTPPGPMELYTTQGRTPIYQFWFYQATSNTLKMGTQLVLEMSENLHILTQLSDQEHFTEFFYELNKSLEAIFAADKPLGKENSSSTHVSDLHPTSNMTHYENTRNDQLTKAC